MPAKPLRSPVPTQAETMLPPIPQHLTAEELEAVLVAAERAQIERHAREWAELRRQIRRQWCWFVAACAGMLVGVAAVGWLVATGGQEFAVAAVAVFAQLPALWFVYRYGLGSSVAN